MYFNQFRVSYFTEVEEKKEEMEEEDSLEDSMTTKAFEEEPNPFPKSYLSYIFALIIFLIAAAACFYLTYSKISYSEQSLTFSTTTTSTDFQSVD